MYKIIDRTGHDVAKGFDNLADALYQNKRFRHSGLRTVVVEVSTKIINIKNIKVSKKRIPAQSR